MIEEDTELNMTTTHLFNSDNKLRWWGYGEWVEEADYIEFEHKGLKCKILRQAALDGINQDYVFGGHLCGYVLLPKEHPLYGIVDNYDMEYDVHGGITFSDFKEEEFYLGFDCAHSGDYVPSMEMFRKTSKILFNLPLPEEFLKYSIFNPTYKNIAFCIGECKLLADQIMENME